MLEAEFEEVPWMKNIEKYKIYNLYFGIFWNSVEGFGEKYIVRFRFRNIQF